MLSSNEYPGSINGDKGTCAGANQPEQKAEHSNTAGKDWKRHPLGKFAG